MNHSKFSETLDRYNFDRQLRLFMMDLIERIEISVRTSLINEHTQKFGPFGYTTSESFPNMQPEKHLKLMHEFKESKMKSREYFALHFSKKYNEEVNLPFWIACELMNFGSTLTIYRGLEYPMQNKIAKRYALDKEVIGPFLHSLLYIRNLCAHHQPLINRILQIKPSIPNKTVWQVPVYINNDRIFGILSLINFISKQIFNKTNIKQIICNLVKSSSNIDLKDIGFPENWQESMIWE